MTSGISPLTDIVIGFLRVLYAFSTTTNKRTHIYSQYYSTTPSLILDTSPLVKISMRQLSGVPTAYLHALYTLVVSFFKLPLLLMIQRAGFHMTGLTHLPHGVSIGPDI